MSMYIEEVNKGRMTREEALKEISKTSPPGELFERTLRNFLIELGRLEDHARTA